LKKIITVLIIAVLFPMALFAQGEKITGRVTTLIENRKISDAKEVETENAAFRYRTPSEE